MLNSSWRRRYGKLSDLGAIFCSIFFIDNLIMVHSSYNIHIQNFKSICAAVGKLCFFQVGEGGGMASYLIQVRFFAQFFY